MRFNSRTPTITECMWVRGLLLLGACVLPVARCARVCGGGGASRWSDRCDGILKSFKFKSHSDEWEASGASQSFLPLAINHRSDVMPIAPPGRVATPTPTRVMHT